MSVTSSFCRCRAARDSSVSASRSSSEEEEREPSLPSRRELAPLGEAYCAVVAALALLQWWWFWKICAKVWRDGARKAPRP
jgi:fatty acid desaturase